MMYSQASGGVSYSDKKWNLKFAIEKLEHHFILESLFK